MRAQRVFNDTGRDPSRRERGYIRWFPGELGPPESAGCAVRFRENAVLDQGAGYKSDDELGNEERQSSQHDNFEVEPLLVAPLDPWWVNRTVRLPVQVVK